MKFGKQLALRMSNSTEWKEYYLDYKGLKTFIKEKSVQLACTSQPDVLIDEKATTYDASVASAINAEFKELLIQELEKVDDRFFEVHDAAEEELEELGGTWHNGLTSEEQDEWRKRLLKVSRKLEDLIDFTQTNVNGFKKILKKFDKHFRPQSTGLPQKAMVDGPTKHSLVTNAHPRALSFSLSPPTAFSPNQATPSLQRRYSLSAEGKSLWATVISYKFVTTEKDEHLLHKAREMYRKHAPPPLVDLNTTALTEKVRELTLADADVPLVQELDLDALPAGRISKVWVALFEGALNPMTVPVIIAKGVRPGPVVGMTSSLHGDEVNGVRVIHRLFQTELDPEQLHGTVVAVIVANVQGFLAGTRGMDGQDLNRLMPGKAKGSAPQQYAYNLLYRLVKKFQYLIDLHTASKGRVNSLYVRADMLNPRTHRMALLQNPQIIVHNTSPGGSLRGAAMELGIPAITVEIGNPGVFQKRFVKNALIGVTNIISSLRMIADDHSLPEYQPVICDRSEWIFTTRGGILNVIPEVNTWVRKGEVIASIHSIFGELIEEYKAPEDSIVIGKEIDPVASSGARIVHLGILTGSFASGKVDDGHL